MSEQGGLGDLTYKDDHRHQTGPGTVTYHVEVQHGRRRSDAKIPESDDGPLDPPYLHHPVDKTHVQVAVESHGKTMDEMDQEAHLTAYQMGSATSPHDMVTKTRILHVEAARKPRPLQGPEHPFAPHPDDPEQCVECNLPESNRHHQDVEFQHRLPQPLAHVEPGWEDEQGSMDRYKPRTWHEDLHEAFDMQRVHEDLQEDEHWGGGRGEEAHARENGYQRSNITDFARGYGHGRTAKGVTFPGKHDEQLPLHPDLGSGMEEQGLYKGSPQLPLYRAVQLPHPPHLEDVRDHLGQSHEQDQAIAHHFVNHAVQGRTERGHANTLGIHWSHDHEATGDLANHAHMEDWGSHGDNGHPVMLEADHPGHEHVIDFSDASRDPKHRDHRVLKDTISPHDYHHAMLPEVPIRPGAPMHLRAIHVQKHDGTYHRIPVGLHTEARRYDGWRPHDRLFGPTKGDQDPRLFHEHRMLPKVREHLLAKMDGFMAKHGGPDWRSWARMYLAGSEASDWWGNNDFDVLVGVDYNAFRKATGSTLADEEITDAFNRAFRADWNDESWHPPFDDQVWHLTGYVNQDSYDIRKIKPYAAYDVGADTWAVKPVQVPKDWGPDKFPESTWRMAERYADEIQRIASLEPASIRQQYAKRLFEHIHTDRSRAFSPRGTGVFDPGNVAEKYLDQRPDHPLALLVEMKNEGGARTTLDKEGSADSCRCCGGSGEHPSGHECYRCDASGQEAGATGSCDAQTLSKGASSEDSEAVHSVYRGLKMGGANFLNPVDIHDDAAVLAHLHKSNETYKRWNSVDAEHPRSTPYGRHWTSDHEQARRFATDQIQNLTHRPPPHGQHDRYGVVLEAKTHVEPKHDDLMAGYGEKEVERPARSDIHSVVAHVHVLRGLHDSDGSKDAREKRNNTYVRSIPVPEHMWRTASAEPTVAYHGTSTKNAKGIIENGVRPGTWLVTSPTIAHSYRDMAEEFHGGGVTIEGHMAGTPHVVTGDPHSPDKWKGAKEAGAHYIHNRGLITTVEHGAFVPKRLHYPDGRVEEVDGMKHESLRTTATDWHEFDTNRHYRRGHQDGAQGVYDQDHDTLSAKADMGIPLEPHEVDYMVGHAAGTQRAREHAQAQHDIKRVWEEHGQAYGAKKDPRFEGVSLKQDDDGWYVTTHRARSDSYPTPEAIPDSKIKFIESTGAKKAEGFEPPTVSGVALQAADTGRLLMIQRSNNDEKDPARGTWEFPGGHHEDGDTSSLHAAIREWEEEVGHPFPEGGTVTHTWRTGPYQGHHVVIPEESAVDFSQGRRTVNPDDPDCDDHEQSAWWDPEHAKKNPALRQEVKDNWSQIVPGLKQVKASLSSLPEGYSYRHIVHQPKFGNARYGDQVPHPSQEDVYNEGPAKAFGGAHLFEHQVMHRGTPVAKLRYSVHPDEPHVLNIEGLAVHQDHQGKGLAIHLGDHMQHHAEQHGMKIDHGTYTDQGHYFAQKYMASPNAKPHLHLPYPDKPTATTGDVFIHHMLDPEEMRAGQHGRTASLNEPQAIGGWIHYHGDPGWHEDHDDALAHKDATGTYHPSLGRVLHGRLKKHHTASLDGVPLPEHEQEARLAPGTFKEQSKPQAAPSDHVVAGARSYCAQRNMPDPHATDYSQIKTSAENTRTIGRAYHSLPDHDPEAVPHYEALRQEVHHQFKHMTEHMGMKVHFVDEDPYSTSKEMMHDVHHNRTIKVLKTERTGGHPYFSNEDNDKFRAVHDVFGHAATGRGFDKHGEEAAYTAHSKMFSAHAQPALETETRGQNHFYNLNGRFAKQKVAIVGKALGTYRRAVDHGRTAMRRIASRVYL